MPTLEERYHYINEHLRKHYLPFMVGFRYAPEGALVRGERYAFLKMDWVDGLRLDEFLSEIVTRKVFPNQLRVDSRWRTRRFAMPIPLRADFDAQRTRGAARQAQDGGQARRLLL